LTPHSLDPSFFSLDSSSFSSSDLVIAVLRYARYKLTQKDVIDAVHTLDPSIPSGTISKYLSRFASSDKYNVKRTATRPYLYYYQDKDQQVKADPPGEFTAFWDANLPLFMHRILIMIDGFKISSNDSFEVKFFNYVDKIKFNLYANTNKIRIDFKCSGWQEALDCHDFDVFCQIIETALTIKGYEGSLDKAILVNVDFNQDIERTMIEGAKSIKVQAFRNALLHCYNKGTGYRKELQFNSLNIPLDQLRKQLSRKTTELKIGTVFDRTNIVLNGTEQALNRLESRNAAFYNHSTTILNEIDYQAYNTHQLVHDSYSAIEELNKAQFSMAINQEQLALSQQRTAASLDVQNTLLLDHDTNIEKKIDNLIEALEILQTQRKAIVRSDTIQSQLLQQLEQEDLTIKELCNRLHLDYSKVYYHLNKLLGRGKVESYKQQPQGRGRPAKVYRIRTY